MRTVCSFPLLISTLLGFVTENVDMANTDDLKTNSVLDVDVQPLALSYVGTFGQKAFYIDRTMRYTQDGAREMCWNMGMRLARFDNKAEIYWIIPLLNVTWVWTDGVVKAQPQSFEWFSDRSDLSVDLTLELMTHPSPLMLFPGDKGMLWAEATSTNTDINIHPLCYLRVADAPGTNATSPYHHPITRGTEDRVHREEGNVTQGLTFLGRYGTKSYYIDRTWVEKWEGEANCATMGMSLAKIDSVAEMVWISQVTTEADDLLWTDGVVRFRASSYQWLSDGETLDYTIEIHGADSGLVFKRGTPPKLATQYYFDPRAYLCYIRTGP